MITDCKVKNNTLFDQVWLDINITSMKLYDDFVILVDQSISCVAFTELQNRRKASPFWVSGSS